MNYSVKYIWPLLITSTLIFVLFESQSVYSQVLPNNKTDVFQEKIHGLELKDQTVIDGVAKLSQMTNIAYSIEFPLKTKTSQAAIPLARFSVVFPSETVSELMDALCSLDSTFTWIRNGNTANIFPRNLESSASYLLNRHVDQVNLDQVHGVQEAVFQVVDQLSAPKEQIAFLQSGLTFNFAKPWTAHFENVTVRDVFDKIAAELGQTYGWQFGGSQDFRIIIFHERLNVKPVNNNLESP